MSTLLKTFFSSGKESTTTATSSTQQHVSHGGVVTSTSSTTGVSPSVAVRKQLSHTTSAGHATHTSTLDANGSPGCDRAVEADANLDLSMSTSPSSLPSGGFVMPPQGRPRLGSGGNRTSVPIPMPGESLAHKDPSPTEASMLATVNRDEEDDDDFATLKKKKTRGLKEVMDKYFKSVESTTRARVNALKVLEKTLFEFSLYREDSILESLVIHYLNSVSSDPDTEVRKKSVELVIKIVLQAWKSSEKAGDLLDVIKSILNRPFGSSIPLSGSTEGRSIGNESLVNVLGEDDMPDVLTGVRGLIDIFKHYMMSSTFTPIALKSFKLLVDHLNKYYSVDATSCLQGVDHSIKKTILSFLLSLRCNQLGQIGLQKVSSSAETSSGNIKYSPFLLCARNAGDGRSPPHTPGSGKHYQLPRQPAYTMVEMSDMFSVVLACLEKEKDWCLVRSTIIDLKKLISSNPTMIRYTASKYLRVKTVANDICVTASKIRRRNDFVIGTCSHSHHDFKDSKVPAKADVDKIVYPLLESLIVYGRYLDPNIQIDLVKAIKDGLENPTFRAQTIFALTRCLMEMQDQRFIRLLPQIMLDISKMAAAKSLAVPKLTFLSTLVLFPQLYCNFTQNEHMCIFAIAIPYTNYGEFPEFTVSLAHRVIALWFLNCKMQPAARKAFVEYVRNNLVKHVENLAREDREMRNRSQSVGPVRASDLPSTNMPAANAAGGNTNIVGSVCLHPTRNHELQVTLHRELFETSMDVFSRYTHSMCTPVPPARPALADFIIDPKTAVTWMVGQNLITICTSHCCQRVVGESGFCGKCLQHCVPFARNSHAFGDSGGANSLSSSMSSTLEDSSEDNTERNLLTSSTESGSKVFIGGNSSSNPTTAASTPAPPPLSMSDRKRHQSAFQPTTKSSLKQVIKAFDDTMTHLPNEPLVTPASNAPVRQVNCSCWCQGWAEVIIRRPTGKTSFMIRVENSLNPPCFCPMGCDSSLTSLLNLFSTPTTSKGGSVDHPSTQSRHSSGDKTVNFARSISERETNKSCANNVFAKRNSAGHTLDQQHPISLSSTKDNNTFTPINSHSEGTSRVDSGLSSANSFRRTSSSPEIERQASEHLFEEGDVEEAKEVRDDVTMSTSPSKVSRTVSLGKGDNQGPEPKISNSALKKTASFSQRKSPSKSSVEEHSEGLVFTAHTGKASSPSARASEKALASGANKKNLHIDLPSGSGTSGSQTSPTKSSPKSPLDSLSPSLESVNMRSGSVTTSTNMRARSQTFSSAPVRSGNVNPLRGAGHSESHSRSAGLRAEFVFLQLYYNNAFHPHFSSGDDHARPFLLPRTEDYERAVRNIDHITPFETHKIGVVYVDQGQEKDRRAIVSNVHGSPRYQAMLQSMGTLIRLSDVDETNCYLGGLQTDGNDGKYTYTWQDNLTQVVFHVATLMPTKERDPECNEKIRHLGNDYVVIAYNDSGADFNKSALTGQHRDSGFLKVCIVITPMDCGVNSVDVQTTDELAKDIGHREPFQISDINLPLFVRQIAIHCNFALHQKNLNNQRRSGGNIALTPPFVSNWVERLRNLKRLKGKLLSQEVSGTRSEPPSASVDSSRPRSLTMMPTSGQIGDDLDFPHDFTNFS